MNKIQFLFLILVFCTSSCQKKVYHLSSINNKKNYVGQKIVVEDKAVEDIILPYRTQLNEKMNIVTSDVQGVLTKGKPSSSLTNFCADAIFEAYNKVASEKLDVVVLNYGGIRVNSIGKGDLLIGEIYELMPFDNMLTVVTMDHLQIKEFFDGIAKSNGWPISKGSGFNIKDEKAQAILVNGQPLDPTKKYKVGMPDYIANGGDGQGKLSKMPRYDSGLFLRDLMIDYSKRIKKIIVDNEARIY